MDRRNSFLMLILAVAVLLLLLNNCTTPADPDYLLADKYPTVIVTVVVTPVVTPMPQVPVNQQRQNVDEQLNRAGNDIAVAWSKFVELVIYALRFLLLIILLVIFIPAIGIVLIYARFMVTDWLKWQSRL